MHRATAPVMFLKKSSKSDGVLFILKPRERMKKKMSILARRYCKNEGSPGEARRDTAADREAASGPRGGKIMQKCNKVCLNRVRPSKSARRYAVLAFHIAKVPEGIAFF